jgi:hypothetical protein
MDLTYADKINVMLLLAILVALWGIYGELRKFNRPQANPPDKQ